MKCVDFLSPNMTFYHKKHTTFRSNIGGSASLIALAISILSFYYFSIDMFLKTNPTTFVSKKYEKFSKIEGEDMFMAFVLLAGNQPIIDIQKKIIFKVSLFTKDNIYNIFREQFDLIDCKETRFYKQNKNNIISHFIDPLNTYWCLPEDLNSTISGKVGDENFSFLQIRIELCKNSTVSNECLSKEEILKQISPSYGLGILLLNQYIELDDYSTPIKSYITEDLLSGTTDQFIQREYYLNNMLLNSDEGWLISQENITRTYQVLEMRDSPINVPRLPYLGTINFHASQMSELYHRSYLKIQTCLANTGGIAKIILFLASSLTEYFSKFNLIVNMSKKIHKNLSQKKLKLEFSSKHKNDEPHRTKSLWSNEEEFYGINLEELRNFTFIDILKMVFGFNTKLSKIYNDLEKIFNEIYQFSNFGTMYFLIEDLIKSSRAKHKRMLEENQISSQKSLILTI